MPQLDNRPELPDIFPETDVTVEGEEHTFKASETDLGVERQYEYTLDKAPVEEVQSIQGVDQDGKSRTFSNGVDYELVSKHDVVFDTFTFDSSEDTYLLTYKPDSNSDSITDESGDTYVNGTDYKHLDADGHFGDKIEWIDGASSPDNNEEFTVEYDVTFPSSVVQWQTDGENLPQDNSIFYVTYRAESVISRYLDAHESELDQVDDALQEVINNKFVDSASGDALDELGKLFGPVIGKRRGRDDVQYRIYLKSIVQSFVSRGTVNGIKLAVSAATDVPIDDITINEDFTDVEYEIVVIAATPVTVELLEEVAEIADPSGVDQVRTRFVIDPDEVEIQDDLSVTEGQQIPDEMSVDDATANFGFGTEGATFEDIRVADATAVDDNKFLVTDQMAVDDANAIDPNTSTVPDEMAVDDNAQTNRTAASEDVEVDDTIGKVDEDSAHAQYWEFDQDPNTTTEWNFFQWTELLDLDRSNAEDIGSADAFAIDANKNTISETAFADDANAIDPNVTTVGDAASTDDAVTVTFNQSLVAEDAGSTDAVPTITTASVAWGTDWEAFNWAKESN